MSELFLKSLKWYVLALCVVIGTSAFSIADEMKSIKPVIIGIFSYGLAYILSAFWKDFKNRLLLAAIVVFFGIAIITPYLKVIIYILTGWTWDINPYALWAVATGVIGVPVMMFVCRRFDD
ncbi:MAG: hypothetical protein KDI13_02030 [Alphaproteobacteria bacterium]|nr:hypothetical protein [Alphaproteobacteria bacterium]